MSFLYHSSLGAWYFFILAAICIYAIARGYSTRPLALVLVGAFLAERTLLATMNGNMALMIGFGGIVSFIAFISVLRISMSVPALVIAFWFSVKILAYMALVGGDVSFGTMAAWTELAGYMQLLIVLGVTLNADRGKLANHSRAVRSRIDYVLHFGKSRVQDERRS